jgi:hypothetical protein
VSRSEWGKEVPRHAVHQAVLHRKARLILDLWFLKNQEDWTEMILHCCCNWGLGSLFQPSGEVKSGSAAAAA